MSAIHAPASGAPATPEAPASAANRVPTEHFAAMPDGVELFYRAWAPTRPAQRALVLFHRGHEHSGRWQDFVDALDLEDAWVFAWDQRGHGRSPGDRGYAESFATLVRDADAFVRIITSRHQVPLENMVIVGHSVGAVLVSAWVHDYAPPIRAMVLVTPALRVKLYVPLAIPSLRMLNKLRPKSFVKSYVKSRMLTHDPVEARRYDEDSLIARSIAVNILLDLHDVSTRLMADAGAITTPTLLLSAGADWVVQESAQQRFFEHLGSPIKQCEHYPDFHHDILHEADRHLAVACIREFVRGVFDRPAAPSSLVDAHRTGYTKMEYDRLAVPLPASSPRGWLCAAQKAFLRTIGRLSAGIRLGWRTGFDSGASLDYVYENRARGVPLLGTLIDRIYLNSPGWRGVRVRRKHLEKLLTSAIAQVRAAGKPVRILDIAAGPGRYVLETLASLRDAGASALLRDFNPQNLEAGRQLADHLGVTSAAFEQGDAFDGAALAAIRPRPTIAIVSGLYELFSDNDRVLASLKGLAAAIEPGGLLIYTGQPWHPQLEFIARTLINRDGRPWVMRRRTQAELDELVRAASFEKLSQEIDAWGIFTVSLARRAGA